MNNLFSTHQSNVSEATVNNAAGGKAYKLSDQVALAKYVCTGTFSDTYNSSAEEQLDKVLLLCGESDPEFIAKLAVYGRQHGKMKDTPAFLVAYLAHINIDLCKKVFSRVIDDAKMLRNFVQIMRSGAIKRKSLGTAPKKLVQKLLESWSDERVFRSDVGNNPSLADIVKMVHPKPERKEREILYAYLLGKTIKEDDRKYMLPIVEQYESFKRGDTKEVPNVPFQFLTSLPLTTEQWSEIACNASFNQTRLNLNTFERHDVLKSGEMVDLIAARLSSPEEVRKSKVLPYQLFTAFMNVENMPQKIHNALQAATEIACENVPAIDGNIWIALDTSGSMRHRVTGRRLNANGRELPPSKARYIDVAALFAAAIQRTNKNAIVLPFDTAVNASGVTVNPYDSIMANAQKLASINGGGTDCSVALQHLNEKGAKGTGVIYISDNESWQHYAGKTYNGRAGKGTGMMHEWEKFEKRNPDAKLVNIDISPSDTSQVANVRNTLLVGGFSDHVFDIIAGFFRGEGNEDYWIKTIGEVKL
jgi:60 kDa SS-A/Ro ribonucleoprotein